jgi:hypothetical protein
MASFSFSIRVEPDRNVIYMTQKGQPRAADYAAVKIELIRAVARVKPGFVLVNDQRSLEPFDEPAMAVARDLIAIINDAGASMVIRIVPSDLISMTKILRALVTAESRYQTVRVSTPEEAEEVLAAARG